MAERSGASQIVGSTDPATQQAVDADAAIRRFAGRDFAYEIISVVNWTRRELIAEQFGDGRIFLLGDAAHQLSPAGGFGLNTGIADAINLAWKLAAVLDGWGGDALLLSYEQERGPIGHRNVAAATDRFRRDIETPGKPGPSILAEDDEGEAARQRVRERLQAQLDRANCGYEYGARYEDAGLQLGYRYESSPIVVREDTPPPPDDMRNYYPLARPGARAPRFWRAPNRSILDLFGRGFTLLRLATDAGDLHALEAAASAAGVPLSVHRFDSPQLAALYNRKLALVRPDGHVAWRSDASPDDARALIDRIRGAG